MPESMLTNSDREIPNISYDQIEGVSPTYVPFRNGQLLSRITALVHAECEELMRRDEELAQTEGRPPEPVNGLVYFGAHAEDAHSWAYPDCTPEFIGAMANAIYIGTYHTVRLVTPLEWMNKAQIIAFGTKLGVPWDFTWSCYKGGAYHCGVCPTCRARQQGFIDAGIKDPTKYEEIPREIATQLDENADIDIPI